MSGIPEAAYPIATPLLQEALLELLKMAHHAGQVKKGANEATKAVNRGVAEIVVLAADTTPLSIVFHLPLTCEDKNTTYCYVSSKHQIGKAVGVSRSVIAAAITSNEQGELNDKILDMKRQIESLVL